MKIKQCSAICLSTPLWALLIAAGTLRAGVVIDQIGTLASYDFQASTSPMPSQIATDFPSYSCVVIDDFAVVGTELRITGVSALFQADAGFAGFEGVSGYQLNFYSSPAHAAGNLTGDIGSVLVASGVATLTQTTRPGSSLGYGLVSLPVDVQLPAAGTYWVGVSPVSASSVTGVFRLMDSGASGLVTPGGSNGKFANPGEGFGAGSLLPTNVNYAYSVTAVPEPAGTLLGILGAGLLIQIRRRPQAVT